MFNHAWFPYSSDEEFTTAMGPFLAEGIEHSEALIVVTTSDNIELLRGYLGTDGDQIEFVESRIFYSAPTARA